MDTDWRIPKIHRDAFIPVRATMAPPARVPAIVAIIPNPFVTAPMSVIVNPSSRRKGVVSAVAITTSSL